MADVTRLSHGASNLPHCSLSNDSFLSSTSASLVRGSFRFRPFSPLRLADAGVMSGNLRPRLASSSSSSPFRIGHRVSALESFWRPGRRQELCAPDNLPAPHSCRSGHGDRNESHP
jgi:hypothetical protein